MTEEYNRTVPQVGTNWWDMPSSRTSATVATATSSSSSNLTGTGRGGYIGGGGWLQGEAAAAAGSSSSMDNNSTAVSGTGMDYHNQDGSQLQIMGLGLSCHPHQSMDWNHQTGLLDSDKGSEIGGFRSMLQEGMAAATNSTNFHHNINETGGGMLFGSQMGQSNLSYSERSLFPPTMHTTGGNNMNAPADHHFIKSRGLSDQLGSRIDNCSISVTCQQGSLLMPPSSNTFHTALDTSSSSSVYDSPNNSSSSILQGLIISPNPTQQSSSSYGYHHPQHEQEDYIGLASNNNESSLMGNSNWPPPSNNKVMIPQFLRNSGASADTANIKHSNNNNQLLHFTNNGPFWNSNTTTDSSGNIVRPGLFFPSLMQNQMGNNTTTTPTFEEKPKFSQQNSMGVREPPKKTATSQTRTTTTAAATGMKRTRGEATMPPFKVRKEKMGDRITALQQLVSPFGKTDTASVLSEAIEYIKFLHEQVSLLSTPYLKSGSGSPLQHQTHQSCDKSKDLPEGARRDLRTRGLCLVPVSSTYPVAHETSVDFWTPTFGGTFR